MQTDPALEWRRLTEHYRELCDDELRNLAVDFADLTDTAKQVLRDEMRSRGLGDPQASEIAPHSNVPQPIDAPAIALPPSRHPRAADTEKFDPIAGRTGVAFGARFPDLVPDTPETDEDDPGPHEYTWKTVLCECETVEEASELSQMLHLAGLDSWVQESHEFGQQYSRVLVAADQLDKAREIAARPIPKTTVDDSKQEIPEFVEPKCPKCGSDEVVLEGVDRVNRWRCEQCNAEWSDGVAADEDATDVTSAASKNAR